MAVNYTHETNLHTQAGASRGLRYLQQHRHFGSLLDIGAGNGTWLSAALQAGIDDVFGIDGVPTDERKLFVPKELIFVADLRYPIDLGKKYDVSLCLEVAEHLPEECAQSLIESICKHSNLIFFSAAVPGQYGDHHINCQWPSYWQRLFNNAGYSCSDEIRYQMWDDKAIEPWYRQNIFMAEKKESVAGTEPRIPSVIHPDMVRYMSLPESPTAKYLSSVESGSLSIRTYITYIHRATRRRLRLGDRVE